LAASITNYRLFAERLKFSKNIIFKELVKKGKQRIFFEYLGIFYY
jgi:hypothetical protein